MVIHRNCFRDLSRIMALSRRFIRLCPNAFVGPNPLRRPLHQLLSPLRGYPHRIIALPRRLQMRSLSRQARLSAHRLWISEGAVEKHVRSIVAKLQLPASDEDHRRVLAVLLYLDAR